jgi:protein arginine kinase activator
MFRRCDRCENPATVHLTEIKDEEKTERHLCEGCARALQVPQATKELQKLLKTFDPATGDESTSASTQECPDCGMTFAEFRQHGRFGCAKDYEIFGDEVERLLVRIHGESRYTGKTPQGMAVRKGQVMDEMARAREALDQAVEDENYEEAARLRDEIRRIGAPDDPGLQG